MNLRVAVVNSLDLGDWPLHREKVDTAADNEMRLTNRI